MRAGKTAETDGDGGEHDSEKAANRAQQEAFREQLAQHDAARCAERETHTEFAAAACGADEQQVCEVRAGDAENEERQRREECAKVAARFQRFLPEAALMLLVR